MSKAIDLTGRRFNRLIVIERSYPNSKYGRVRWLCKCDCGKEKVISSNHLVNNEIKSCGCLIREERKKNPHNILEWGFSSMRQLISIYKASAKKRRCNFELTKEQFFELTKKDCYYCGAKPSNVSKFRGCNGSYIYNGIDRIDNTKGYEINNVVTCCKQCNTAKGILTLQEFKDWGKKFYNKSLKE